MSEHTPTTGEVRDSLVYLNKYHAKKHGDVDLLVVGSETAAQFDRWLAQERARVWEEGYDIGADLHLPVSQHINPYRSTP